MALKTIPYHHRELLAMGRQPWLRGRQLDCVAFPLGGLGTGCISLGGWGQLRDWEIRNRPAKGFTPMGAFFTLRTEVGRAAPIVRVLQGPAGGTWMGNGHSGPRASGEGLPHFREVAFRGEYPFATVRLRDPDVPLQVTLEAFSPFIPLNDKDSSLPVAVLLYHFRNFGRRTVRARVFGNHVNIIEPAEGMVNEVRTAHGLTGLFATTTAHPPDSPRFGSTALSTPAPGALVWPRWHGSRAVHLHHFWEVVTSSLTFPPQVTGNAPAGTIAVPFTLAPGGTVTIPFLITWHFPIVEHWRRPKDDKGCECPAPTWRNWYATQWADAWEVAIHVHTNFARLHEETRRFHRALFTSTLPRHVLDAVSSQISILRTPTVLRLEDGTLYGFEGCNETSGCCEGSCTHVWNYAQALPYLFPALQRSMREADYTYAIREDGFVQFRLPLPLGTPPDWRFHPCADGQMGTVLQVYREWLISGDTAWLRCIWPKARRALEFAWKYWDADRDGVMEGMQHNTYDIEFYGPNTVCGSLYLGALRAAEELARALGEEDFARECRRLFESGARWSDEHLFNGEYYEQAVRPDAHLAWPEPYREQAIRHGKDDRFPDWPAWQYGKGCLSDQLLGEWYAAMLGLGHLYNPRHVRRALRAIFKHNWRASVSRHPCFYRTYALNEEAGLLVATWPRGERPGCAFYFADEVWTGIEYQVASHLIYEGMVEAGLAIVLGARRRYDGTRRNPWDEIECGHHYARAMASYALLTAVSGFHYSAPKQTVTFSPRLFPERFRSFFSVGSAWGTYTQQVKGRQAMLTLGVHYGALTLREIRAGVPPHARRCICKVARIHLPASVSRHGKLVVLSLHEPVHLEAGQSLRVYLG